MDPRFDRTFGKFEEAGFNQAYSFIGEIQKNEQKILEKEMNKECDVERRESLKRLYDRLGDMQRAKQQVLERKQIVKDHLKSEKVLVEQGKKPFYLRKSDVERLHLSKQFEKIKKKVKSDKDLERILEKRRKRKDSRQRKHIPLQ